jgi:death on curing protein
VARRPHEPRWLNRIVIDSIHDSQIREHGGLTGIRDENVLESALARPKNKWSYGHEIDLATLAGAYAFGFITNHPYNDGNKRIGFLLIVTFLGINGYDFNADDAGVLTEIFAVAAGRISEDELTDWIRKHMKRARKMETST